MEDKTTQERACLNCGHLFKETHKYCPECGQKSDESLTFGVLFSNTISNYFSYDARFLKSFIPLVFKPGFIAREFVKGKRLKYLHPAQYYLFVSVIFFFLFSISTRRGEEQVDKMLEQGINNGKNFELDSLDAIPIDTIAFKETVDNLKKSNIKLAEEDLQILDSIAKNGKFNTSFSDVNGNTFGQNKMRELDSLIEVGASQKEKLSLFGVDEETGMITEFFAKQSLKLYESKGAGILGVFYDTIPISMFFLIPIFALILKVLYFNKSKFAHDMVFSFYFFTFLFIVLSLIILFNQIIDIPNWIDWLVALSTFIYLLISLKRFYNQNYFITFIKMSVLSFSYLMFVVPLSLVIMLAVAFVTY